MTLSSPTFPVLRWVSLFWMVIWLPAYFRYWGWANVLHLCDIAVILSFAGIWSANPLLLSSQTVSSLGPGLFWLLDVGWRAATGRFLVGGTDYMWDARCPLWVRLLSAFHIALPLVLLWALRRVGYDKRGLALQAAILAALLIISRFLSADLNMNYSYRDPVFHRAWGPAPVHLTAAFLIIAGAVYWPTHLLLRWLFPAAPQ